MSRPHPGGPPARGYALIIAMIFLLLLSAISLAMLHRSGFQARIAGNVLDKARAQQLADIALREAERLLDQDGSATANTCSGVLQADALARTPVCDALLAQPSDPPWATRVELLPPGLSLATATPAPGTASATPADPGSAYRPAFHIAWLGYATNSDRLFLVTAAGCGAYASSVSVVRSVYVLATDTRCADCP